MKKGIKVMIFGGNIFVVAVIINFGGYSRAVVGCYLCKFCVCVCVCVCARVCVMDLFCFSH